MNPLIPERFIADENLIEKDYDYLHCLIPAISQSLFDSIEDICDRLEYEGSFLYDECPDKTTILNLTDKIHEEIHAKLSVSETPTLKDLIQTMLCDEILYRRCRYYHKIKKFQ